MLGELKVVGFLRRVDDAVSALLKCGFELDFVSFGLPDVKGGMVLKEWYRLAGSATCAPTLRCRISNVQCQRRSSIVSPRHFLLFGL